MVGLKVIVIQSLIPHFNPNPFNSFSLQSFLFPDHTYNLYKATVRDHEAWLGLENVTAHEEWETMGMRLVAAYQETIQRMSDHIAHLSTHYDMYGIIIAIGLLWMVCHFSWNAWFLFYFMLFIFSQLPDTNRNMLVHRVPFIMHSYNFPFFGVEQVWDYSLLDNWEEH